MNRQYSGVWVDDEPVFEGPDPLMEMVKHAKRLYRRRDVDRMLSEARTDLIASIRREVEEVNQHPQDGLRFLAREDMRREVIAILDRLEAEFLGEDSGQ